MNSGVVLVSAAGNQSITESVCCPSLSEHSIAVGGCIARCTASIESRGGVVGPDITPPEAIWVHRPDNSGLSEVVCSARGCGPGEDCESNREITEWSGNPRFVAETPDTLAPAYFPVGSSNGPIMQRGTSFAAPIVTASVLNVLRIIKSEGKSVQPSVVRKHLRISGDEVGDVPVGVLNSFRFANELLTDKDLAKIRRKI